MNSLVSPELWPAIPTGRALLPAVAPWGRIPGEDSPAGQLASERC